MTSGIINIVLGGAAIAAGLTGHVLVFTHSSEALVAGGALIACWGAYQIFRDRRRAS
jgi:hypothetical protein